MMKNPVMFVVEVGATLTTAYMIRDWRAGTTDLGFTFQITLWLWFTVLFANFAEAMAEGRGKAQADTLRKTKSDTIGHRLSGSPQLDRAIRYLREELASNPVKRASPPAFPVKALQPLGNAAR